ncbi:MAG TPA: TolC family protein [Gemmatimonadales bacterium]|nr:TolC family protein [Gemmatimonadales bacterium]
MQLTDRLTLEQVLETAVSRSPLIQAAAARVDAARGSRRTAGALPNPVLTYQVENTAFPGQDLPTGFDRETSFFGTLPLEPLYQRRPLMSRAAQGVRAADADLTAARRQVGLDAARAFYRLALAQIAVGGAEDIRRRLASVASLNRSRVREGTAAEADLIRVDVEVDRAEAEAVSERIELGRAWAELKPFIDSSLAADAVGSRPRGVEVDEAAERISSRLAPLSDFIAQARRSRPDLAAARARVGAARAEASFQRALTVRQVGATFGNKRIAGVNTMILGVSLPIPLFDRNRGEIQRATGERIAAERELEWSERLAVADVEAAYEAARLLRDQVNKLQGTFLQRAEESRRITLAAYEEGAVSLLQVLDASRTLAEARLTYYRTIFAGRESLLELNVAVGLDPTAAADIPKPRAAAASTSLITGDSR